MKTWFQRLLTSFLTILVVGSVFLPVFSAHAQLLDPEETNNGLPTDMTSTGTGQTNQNQTPQTPQTTQTPAQAEVTGSGFQQSQPFLPICSVVVGEGSIEGCFVRIIYYVIVYPSVWIAGVAGQIFDYFIAFTFNSNSYHANGFVEKGWRVLRDIANASFIFILLYIAIRMIVGGKSSSLGKMIANIIIVAVIINFSLFTTRVIIDAGNILGRVFYEKIVVENDDISQTTNYTTLSSGILKLINPQQLLSRPMFSKRHSSISTSGISSDGGNNNLQDTSLQGGDFAVGAGFIILILLMSAAVNIALTITFVSTSIFFIGRTLGLWIMMITSPISFATIGIPFVKIDGYDFSSWIKKTVSLSFMGVVFMFFLYLTMMFLDVAFNAVFALSTSPDNQSTISLIMSVLIPTMAVIFLLNMAKKQAKDMSGEFGGAVVSGLKTALKVSLGAAGLTLGAAAGAGAILGRQTLGRWGASAAAKADTATAMGRFKKRLGTKMSKATWDARNVNIPKPVSGIMSGTRSALSYASGGALNSNDFNLTNTRTLGGPSDKGYAQRREEYARQKIERAKMYKADESATMDNLSGTYTYEEVDPITGKVVKKTGTVSGSASVNSAKSEKAKAQRELEDRKAEIHKSQNYDEKKRELEKLERELEEKEKSYKELLDRKKAGEQINQSQIDAAKKARDTAKNGQIDPTTGAVIVEGVKQQKEKIKDVEKMYLKEANKVAEAEARISAAERALAKRNADILSKYADSVEAWSAVPDMALTHRFGGNRDAVDEIRSMSDREDARGDKK